MKNGRQISFSVIFLALFWILVFVSQTWGVGVGYPSEAYVYIGAGDNYKSDKNSGVEQASASVSDDEIGASAEAQAISHLYELKGYSYASSFSTSSSARAYSTSSFQDSYLVTAAEGAETVRIGIRVHLDGYLKGSTTTNPEEIYSDFYFGIFKGEDYYPVYEAYAYYDGSNINILDTTTGNLDESDFTPVTDGYFLNFDDIVYTYVVPGEFSLEYSFSTDSGAFNGKWAKADFIDTATVVLFPADPSITSFTSDSGQGVVPIPSSVFLLSSGLVGLVVYRKRKIGEFLTKQSNTIKTLGPLLLSLLLLLYGTSVNAATVAQSSVTLDWSQFTVMGVDIGFGTPFIDWLSQSEEVGAEANESYDSDSANDWTTDLNVYVSDSGAYANTWATSISIGSFTTVDDASSNDGINEASGYASREGNFIVHGTGIITFMVPYSIDLSISGGSSLSADETTRVSAGAYLGIVNADETRWSDNEVYLVKDLYDDGLGNWSEDGFLMASLFFTNGEEGTVYIETDSGASGVVPLPSALMLLGSGLVAFLVTKGRQ